MDSLFAGLESKRFNGFLTPVPPKSSQTVLKVPRDGKVRSKSDSNSPFAKNIYNEAKGKMIEWNDENFSVCKREKRNSQTTFTRSPLQAFKSNSGNVNNSQYKVSSIGKYEHKPLFSTPQLPKGPKTPTFTAHNVTCTRLGLTSTHRSRRAIKDELSYSNAFNENKQFVVFDETPTRYPKGNFQLNEHCHTPTQNLVKSNSQVFHTSNKVMATKGKALNTSKRVPSSTNESSKCQDDKTKNNQKTIYGFEDLPNTETIGNLFWDENIELEEAISLQDMYASANIWDIKENNSSSYCSPNWSTDSSEPELMPEPNHLFPLNMEPEIIEFPWNDLQNCPW